MVVTLRTEEEEARRQSGHEGCAAASAARSTGEAGEGEEAATADTCAELAAKKGAKDTEGTFTSAWPFAATLMPPAGKEHWLSDWATGTAIEKLPDSLERASATTLDCPAI
jgi:hypothetical protein